MEPCMMCTGAIIQARIPKVVYGVDNDSFGYLSKLDNNKINVVNNVMKYSKDPKEEFKFWIDFGFANGYDALIIDTIKNGNWFIINGYDVQLVFVGVVVLFMYIIISIYRCLYWYFCAPCESKKGQKRKKHKFD